MYTARWARERSRARIAAASPSLSENEGSRSRKKFGWILSSRASGVPKAHRIDLLVADKVVVELKAVEQLHPVHLAQVMTYLRVSGAPVGSSTSTCP